MKPIYKILERACDNAICEKYGITFWLAGVTRTVKVEKKSWDALIPLVKEMEESIKEPYFNCKTLVGTIIHVAAGKYIKEYYNKADVLADIPNEKIDRNIADLAGWDNDNVNSAEEDYMKSWIKNNYPFVDDKRTKEEILKKITSIREEYRSIKDKDMDLGFMNGVGINTEAMSTMSDAAFSKAINPQSEGEKELLLAKLHPVFVGRLSCSSSSFQYAQYISPQGIKVAATIGYSEFLCVDHTVTYAQKGYATVWDYKQGEFWIIKLESTEESVLWSVNENQIFGTHLHKRAAELRSFVEKLKDKAPKILV